MNKTDLFIDAHVHFYDCFDPCLFLSSASANLSAAAAEGRTEHAAQAAVNILLMTETDNEDGFQRLQQAAKDSSRAFCSASESWFCHPTAETDSLAITSDSGKELFVIAGRQIVSREGLEIQALATIKRFEDGQGLVELIEQINHHGALPAMPWGTGKWLGQRGKLMSEMRGHFVEKGVRLSDSGIRPWCWPKSGLFNTELAEIAGTDPLPIAAEAGRTGSFGFSISADWNPERPASSLRAALKDHQLVTRCFGHSQSLLSFLTRQLAIRT